MTGPQGPRGYTGAPGTPGQAGPQGQPGPKGDTGYADAFVPDSASITAVGQAYVDADGYLEVCTSLDPIAFVKGALVKGPKGDKGEAGEQGEPGLTAAVEVNGQVYTADYAGKITLPNYPEEVVWGNIKGTLSNQTDLKNALNAKQNVISDLADIREGAALGKTALQDDVMSILVTKNTDQTITGKKTFNGVVAFGDENGEGGSIHGDVFPQPDLNEPSITIDSSTNENYPYKSYISLKSSKSDYTSESGPTVFFKGNLNPVGDNKFDIGSYNNQIKDLYISGNLTNGPTKISVANIPSKSEIQSNYVSCAEAQYLTDEQKNRAKGNLDLPFIHYEYTNALSNKSTSIASGSQSIYIYDSKTAKLLKNLDVGSKFVITVATSSTDPIFTESIECEVTTSGSNAKVLTDVTNYIFFDNSNINIGSDSYFSFYKKDTAGDPHIYSTMYISVDYYKAIYANPLSYKFISGNDFLDTNKAYLNVDDYYQNTLLWIQGERGSYPVAKNETGVVIGFRNSISGNLDGGIVVGKNNKVYSGNTANLLVGYLNALGNSKAKVDKLSLIGIGLTSTQNTHSKGLAIGRYNEKTSKYIPYDLNTTYNTGDCVTPSNSNYTTAVWRCKADGTTGSGMQPPTSGTAGNNYWEYVDNGSTTEYAFAIGNGTSDTDHSNAFTIDVLGNVVSAGTMTPTGADYAEYFEFEDGNPNREDRIGYLVELSGAKIKLANGTDILGAVSSTMGVIGDAEEMNWHGKYERDEFGRPVFEEVEVEKEITNEETGETEIVKELVTTKKLSKKYDPNRHYAPRCDRPEWAPVGLLGKVLVRHDGTLSAGDYVKAINGIASKSEEKTNVRVLEVVSEKIVKVLIK